MRSQMLSLLRLVSAVACLVLLQGLLYVVFLTRPLNVQKLTSETEATYWVGSVSPEVNQHMEWHSRNWSEWQAHEETEKLSQFQEEVRRDLSDMKVKINGFEEWVRNTSAFLEMVRLWVDSESGSTQKKLRNEFLDETPNDGSSQSNARNELIKPVDEYSPNRNRKREDFQKNSTANFPVRLPISGSHVNVTHRPLNPLEEYFLTVSSKKREIREGPIVNPFDFPYVITPGYRTCAGQNVFLIAFVPTAMEHYEFRRTIRNTWAITSDFRLPIRCVFVVGRSFGRNADRIQRLIEQESNRFGDIIQADFLDTYNNLTYKSLVGLRWVTTYCPEAKYVLKIDDDTLVNMFALLDKLQQELNRNSSDMKIFCRAIFLDKVHRAGKWGVLESVFRHVFYPPYCSGPAYVLTMSMASQVVRDSVHVPFFPFEDVYVTGFVTMLSGDSVRFVQWNHAFLFSGDFPRIFQAPYRNNYLFATQVNNNHLYTSIWHRLRQLYVNSVKQPMDADVRNRNKINYAPQQNRGIKQWK